MNLNESNNNGNTAMKKDLFGGFTSVKSAATGFFRIDRAAGAQGDRWWFIDPDGNAFFATGFNHAKNKEMYMKIIADAYLDNANPGSIIKFNTDEEYFNYVADDIEALNMTALGGDCNLMEEIHKWERKVPYIYKFNFSAQMTHADKAKFPDIFSKAFEERCRKRAKEICSVKKDDPYLLGYQLTDCIEWPIIGRASKRLDVSNWLDALKRMGPESEGKRAYVQLMCKRHEGNIRSFNRVYGTDFESFEEILSNTDYVYQVPCEAERAEQDDRTFISLLAEQFYNTTCKAIRDIDTNHLILGDIFDGNRPIEDEVLEAAAKNIDVISIQYYGYFKDQIRHLNRLYEKCGKPILLADSCYSVISEKMPRTCGPRVASQAQRALDFEIYARQIMKVDYILGWFWCGYIDMSIKYEPRRQHSGIKDEFGNFHEPLASSMKKVFGSAYEIISGAEK